MDPTSDQNSPPSPAPGASLERGQTVGRFVVIGLVGRGGMGEVYAAYDPELDRKVAIKLLRARGASADGSARLLREAQATAKLSHPNVVIVYDVGTIGEGVFIAMEFVEGRTLNGWMHASKRTRREILQVALAAGRGLGAAHAAGLVHRDFKPDNVMITLDGQVRVMDFGLARQAGEAESAPRVSAAAMAATAASEVVADMDATMELGKPEQAASSGKYLSVKLTQTGAMMGTPAYMAPEQFAIQPTDARTDQFSFCVALYELLYGKRPFEGDSFLALMTNVTTGTVTDVPAGTKVPGWIRKILLRGLSTDPEKRFESMNALLDALETDPTVRWRRVGSGVALIAVLAAAGLALRQSANTQSAACQGGGARWSGIWEAAGATSPQKDAIRGAFLGSGRSYAGKTFTGVARVMDDYVRRWVAMYTDACEATNLRREQSAEVLDLRMSCLQERLTSASALSDVFAHADGTVVENALPAAGGLPVLDSCADVASLKAVVKPPSNDALKKRVDALGVETARLSALSRAGHCTDAAQLAETLLPRVREAGYLPLLARTLVASGRLFDQCLDAGAGIARLKEGYKSAIAARDDATGAEAALFLTGVLSDRAGDVAQGRDWLEIASGTLQRFDNHPTLDAWLLNAEGLLLINEGRGQDAVDVERKVIAAKEKLLGSDDPDVALSWNSYGNALMLTNASEAASEAFSRALDGVVRTLGPEHPFVALVSNNLGEALNAARRHAEARAAFTRALDTWRKAGTDESFVSYGLTGLGLALVGEGHPTEAVAPLEEALRIRVAKKSGPETLAETRFGLAQALWTVPAERARARALAREARAEYARTPKGAARLPSLDAWLAQPLPGR